MMSRRFILRLCHVGCQFDRIGGCAGCLSFGHTYFRLMSYCIMLPWPFACLPNRTEQQFLQCNKSRLPCHERVTTDLIVPYVYEQPKQHMTGSVTSRLTGKPCNSKLMIANMCTQATIPQNCLPPFHCNVPFYLAPKPFAVAAATGCLAPFLGAFLLLRTRPGGTVLPPTESAIDDIISSSFMPGMAAHIRHLFTCVVTMAFVMLT